MRQDRALNRLSLPLELAVRSPLVIRAAPKPGGLDQPIAQTGTEAPLPYVPGASLRGVLRRVARRWLTRLGPRALGDPSPAAQVPAPERYRRASLEARLFGDPGLRGRIHVPDLLPCPPGAPLAEAEPPARLRRTTPDGRVVEALAPGATLYGQIVLTNFQTWQLGLVALALAALDRGDARLGGGGARGQGRVGVHHPGLVYEQPANSAELPLCLGELSDPDAAAAHGLLPAGELPAKFGEVRGLSRRFEVPPEQVPEWLAAGQRALEALS